MGLKINEAFDYAKKEGRRVKKFDMAQELWSESSLRAAQANLSNLCSGFTKKIDIAMVPIICERLGVTADYLFGLSEHPTREGELQELRTKVESLLTKLEEEATEMRKNL